MTCTHSLDNARCRTWTDGSARWVTIGLASITAGAAAASLVRFGRPALPLPSLEWAGFAALVAVLLLALFAAQAGALWLLSRRAPVSCGRTIAWSFTPLLLLWPLVLLVTFWDWANHVFVFHPAVGLWWGGVAFAFAVTQLAVLPVQLDGGASWMWGGLWRALGGLRHASLTGTNAFPVVLLAYLGLRLTVRFAFDTARWSGPPYDDFYRHATLTDQGVYPFLQRWSEYPPGFPWLSAGVYRAVSFFGVTYDRYYVAITLALLVFELGILVLVYKLAERMWDRQRAMAAAWAYTVLAFPIYEWMRTFTAVAVFFVLLAVYLAVARRPHTAMLAAVCGGLTKAFPLVAAVLLLRYAYGRRERLQVVGVGVAAAAVILVPLWCFGRGWFEASIANMMARPPWQTVWALWDGTLAQGWVNPYRLNPEYATQFDHAGQVPEWFWPVLPIALLVFFAYMLLRARPPDHPRTQLQFTLLVLIAFTLCLKGWSPGFINWFLPFFVILWPGGRGLALALAVGAFVVFWRPVSAQLGEPAWLAMTAISLRTALFVAIGVWSFRAVRRERHSSAARPSSPETTVTA